MQTGSSSFSDQILTHLALFTVYIGLLFIVPLDGATVVLNGMFVGAMVSVGLAFGNLIFGSIFGTVQFGRVQRMTIGFGYLWLVVCCFVLASTYLRVFDYPTNATMLGVMARYYAIVAATYMVTAPDYGLGLFYGRDRRLLWGALAVGAVVSAVVIYFQIVPLSSISFI